MATEDEKVSKKLNYVAAVLDNSIVIKCSDKNEFIFLRNIGAKRKFIFGIEWYIHYKTTIELATFFAKLRDEGFLFSYDQHGWGPSDVFQYLRKNDVLSGDFIEVSWKGPNKEETRKI